MKLTIIGSSTFKQEMLDYQAKLEKLGHEAVVHPDYAAFLRGEKQDTRNMIQGGEHAKAKRENDYIRRYHNAIMHSDAVLALNFEKKGIANYIGCNTLMEIAFAYTAGKKVFLLNPIPDQPYINDEIHAMEPVVLNDDLSLIK